MIRKRKERVPLNKRVVANNPLSQNLAKLLGYYDEPIKKFRSKIVQISKKTEKSTTPISINTIISWIFCNENSVKQDASRSEKFPRLEKLISFAQAAEINDYWSLFLCSDTNKHMGTTNISEKKQRLIEYIIWIDDNFLNNHDKEIRSFLISLTREKMDHFCKETSEIINKYSELIKLLSLEN